MLTAPLNIALSANALACAAVVSSHHQAVAHPGRLRVVAASPDSVIEAIDDPSRPYYLGVQWHPERGEGVLMRDLIQRFVATCAQNTKLRTQHV